MPTATRAPSSTSHRFVNDMQPGEQLDDQVYLVSQKDLRTTTNGSMYIHVVLVDRTGQVLARIWNATQPQYEGIPEGGFLRVRGRTESYKGNLQFIIEACRAADVATIDVADFMPTTKHNIEEMWNRVLTILRTIQNPHLINLIKMFVKDEPLMTKFKRAPAAVQLHHAYIGGLLEHTLSVLDLATLVFGKEDASTSHYPDVSRDLVLTGIFLHDIGKTAELTYDTNFTYSNAGQLLGHITQAAIWIDQKIGDVEQETGQPFPADIQNVLTHIVLSHHGTYEFGSPRLPACPEAVVVHYLDNIDAKVHMFLAKIADAKNGEEDWTEYVRTLETRIFRKDVMGVRGGKVEN